MKRVSMFVGTFLLLSVASVIASASALPSGLSYRLTIAGSNGGANNCAGNSIVNIFEQAGGKDVYGKGPSQVDCNGKYGFGPVEGEARGIFSNMPSLGR
jgi:hypothetical protein